MSISIRQDAPSNQLSSMTSSSRDTTTDMQSKAPSSSPTKPTEIKSSEFSYGDTTLTNIASALGVESTQHTMTYQTKLMQQECTLQQRLATMLGGAGSTLGKGSTTGKGTGTDQALTPVSLGGLSGGLYGVELTLQCKAANDQESALESAGTGQMEAGAVSAGATTFCLLGTGATIANVKPNAEMSQELDNAEALKMRLDGADATPADGLPEQPDELLSTADRVPAGETKNEQDIETQAKNMIKSLKGSPDRDYNLQYRKNPDSMQKSIQDRAIKNLKDNEMDRTVVKTNVEEKISQLKSKIALKQTERLNIASSIVGQAGNSGSSFAQGEGQQNQAVATGKSQTESAESQYFEKMIQSWSEMMRSLQQASSTAASASDSLATQTAFFQG